MPILKCFLCLPMVSALLFSFNVLAIPNASASHEDQVTFKALFDQWTQAFNQKDLDRTCELFSPKVIGRYQEYPDKSYNELCSGFEKIFKEKDQRYQYQYKFFRIYRSHNLAVIRIQWNLKVFQKDQLISETEDQGIDILEKNEQTQQWKIIEYLGFGKQLK